MAMGYIIAAVAVFEIHIERNAVATMSDSTMRRPFRPAAETMRSARRRCAPQNSSAAASRKPARKRKIISLAYGAVMSRIVTTPKSGRTMIGSREVTASGTGSVSHQSSIQAPTPSTSRWSGPSAAGPNRTHAR